MTKMRIEEVLISKILERPKDRLYAERKGSDWREAIESLKKNPKNPDYQYVYLPIEVVCVSKSGNQAIYPDCFFRIVDGKHRYFCLKAIGSKTIKVRFSWHDTEKDIAERREQREAYRSWKRHKCGNCKNLRSLRKGRKIKVNDTEKLCFFQCKTKGDLMNADDIIRINKCKDFNEK